LEKEEKRKRGENLGVLDYYWASLGFPFSNLLFKFWGKLLGIPNWDWVSPLGNWGPKLNFWGIPRLTLGWGPIGKPFRIWPDIWGLGPLKLRARV